MSDSSWLALDIGMQRIGAAVARTDVKIARPLVTLSNDEHIFQNLSQLMQEYAVQEIVVGLPRGLEGQDTEQTAYTERFVEDLRKHVAVPIRWQDEALTSQKAEQELASRKKPYAKGDVDALAATYILEDYIAEHARGSYV